MRHKSFDDMQCPIARSLERVGEWWSMLILRDALLGLTRFDQFQENLGIAPNILTRRLKALVEAGVLERRGYSYKRRDAGKAVHATLRSSAIPGWFFLKWPLTWKHPRLICASGQNHPVPGRWERTMADTKDE